MDYEHSRLIRVTSTDTTVGASPNEFLFKMKDQDLDQIKHVSLKSVIMPNSMYNINSYNNLFNFTDSSGTTSVTIPVGQYSTTTLLVAINALITNLVLTQDAITQKIVFTNALTTTITTKATNPLNTISQVLGLIVDSPVGFTSHTATALPDLMGLKHVYVGSQTLSNNNSLITSGENKTNVFCDIPINVSFGLNQTKDILNVDNLDYSDFHSYKNISTIDMALTDQDDNPLELNGLPFIFVFRVWG